MHRIVVGLVVLSLGCGLTQVKGPASNRPPNVRPDCTTTDRPLKIDGAFGATGVLFVLLGIGLSQSDSSDSAVPAAMIIGGLGLTVAMLASSGVGYSKVKKCRKAVEEFDRANAAPPAYPPGYPYPPPPPQQPPAY